MTQNTITSRSRVDRELSDVGRGKQRGYPFRPILIVAAIAVAGGALLVWAGLGPGRDAAPAEGDPTLAAPPVPALPKGLAFYAAPDGKPGHDGSLERPVDLVTALSENSPAGPGDTIYLRGGTYVGPFESALRGLENDPIVVRQYPGERAILDGAPGRSPVITVGGAFTWFWGFELTHSGPSRRSEQVGRHPTDLERGLAVLCNGQQIKFINLVVHDLAGGFEIAKEATGTELYGNTIFYNGWFAKDVTEGDGIRVQGGDIVVRDNAVFKQFGEGIAVFSGDKGSAYLEGNVAFNNGAFTSSFTRNLMVSGGRIVLKDNATYFGGDLKGGENNFGLNAGCTSFTAVGNYFAHLDSYPLTLAKCGGRFDKNTLTGVVDTPIVSRHPDNTYRRRERPQELDVRIRPNLYDPSRTLVVVFNWPRRTSLALDLSQTRLKAGASYEVRNVQDPFGRPIATGTYTGEPITIHLSNATVAKPLGDLSTEPGPTPREFGVFQVVDTTASTTPAAHAAQRLP
jgi:hypothetical protein